GYSHDVSIGHGFRRRVDGLGPGSRLACGFTKMGNEESFSQDRRGLCGYCIARGNALHGLLWFSIPVPRLFHLSFDENGEGGDEARYDEGNDEAGADEGKMLDDGKNDGIRKRAGGTGSAQIRAG